MTTQPDADLRTTLHRIADSTTPLPVDDGLWQRGRAARSRAQVLAVVAVLALVVSVGGVATLVATTDREARTASNEVVEGGAIPSRIEVPGDLSATTDLAVGRASVAFVDGASGAAIVVGATTGEYHRLTLPDAPEAGGPLALSPDGRTLAWANHRRIHTVDLRSGARSFSPHTDEPVTEVTDLAWVPSSQVLIWSGTDDQGAHIGGVVPVTGSGGEPLSPTSLRGIPSPSGDLVAVTSRGPTGPAARFLQRRGGPLERALPTDLYPGGATVRPLGWTAPTLVLAELYAPTGSYVEGRHLALFTSPDRPSSEWTYRIVMRDLADVADLSIAVDLVPDLDGTSSQRLTHDFTSPANQRDISWMIGLGVAAAIAVLLGLLRLWRRLA